MADEQADQGCAFKFDYDPIFSGPQKYGSLLLRARRSMQTLLDEKRIGHRLPRDEAPNRKIVKTITDLNPMQAARGLHPKMQSGSSALLISFQNWAERAPLQISSFPTWAMIRAIHPGGAAHVPSGLYSTVDKILRECPSKP